MKNDTKLTTVKILKGIYSDFKHLSFDSNITLQKVVNRTIDKYISDKEYREELNEYTDLQVSGSSF